MIEKRSTFQKEFLISCLLKNNTFIIMMPMMPMMSMMRMMGAMRVMPSSVMMSFVALFYGLINEIFEIHVFEVFVRNRFYNRKFALVMIVQSFQKTASLFARSNLNESDAEFLRRLFQKKIKKKTGKKKNFEYI